MAVAMLLSSKVEAQHFMKDQSKIDEYPPMGPTAYVDVAEGVEHTHTMIFIHGLSNSGPGVKKYFWTDDGQPGPLFDEHLKVVLPSSPT